MSEDQLIAGFAAHMREHGLNPPRSLAADGKLRRFPTSDKPGDLAGGCVLHATGYGACWNWRTGLRVSWCHRDRQSLTVAEREALSRQIDQQRRQAADELAEQRYKAARLIDWILAACQPVADGDPVSTYLASRALSVPTGCQSLLLHPALAYWEPSRTCLGKFPTMVAPVVADLPHQAAALGRPANRVVSLHRTYLTPDGRKADVPQPKKLSSACDSLRGSSIRLAPPKVINGMLSLGVSEGIETALAATAGSGVPCWAAVSASGMKKWQWPTGLQSLYVFADNDASGAGQEAAAVLSARAMAAGLEVRTLIPPTVGQDWADVWAAAATARA